MPAEHSWLVMSHGKLCAIKEKLPGEASGIRSRHLYYNRTKALLWLIKQHRLLKSGFTPLHTLSLLHKSRRVSSRCSFFAGAAGGFFVPCAYAVAQTCRLCCSDNAESAAHRISMVQFAPQAHRARLVGSRQLGSGPEPSNGPSSAHSATGCAAAQSPARSRHHAARPNSRGASESRTAVPAPHTTKRTAAKPRLRTAALLESRA